MKLTVNIVDKKGCVDKLFFDETTIIHTANEPKPVEDKAIVICIDKVDFLLQSFEIIKNVAKKRKKCIKDLNFPINNKYEITSENNTNIIFLMDDKNGLQTRNYFYNIYFKIDTGTDSLDITIQKNNFLSHIHSMIESIIEEKERCGEDIDIDSMDEDQLFKLFAG